MPWNLCLKFAVEYDVKFNSSKSIAMRIGARYDAVYEPLKLAGDSLQFVDSVKYLGVWVLVGKHFSCSVNCLKMKLFRVLIAYIYGLVPVNMKMWL